MRSIFLILCVLVFWSSIGLTDEAKAVTTAPVVIGHEVTEPKPAQSESVADPLSTKPIPQVVQDESMSPPRWIQDAVVQAKSFPVIGPIIVKALSVLALIVTITTALCACLITVLGALKQVTNQTGLCVAYDKVVKFQNSRFMYYLKYLSIFNAQKTTPLPPVV